MNAMLVATGARATDLPVRKAGLWESKTTSPDGNTTARQCIDEKTDQIAQAAFGGGQNCAKRTIVATSEWSSVSWRISSPRTR